MKYLLTLVIVFALSACGGKNKPDNPTPPISKAVLVAPAQDAACNTGTVIATNKSIVTLKWNKVDNAASYELHLTNLLTRGSIIQTVATTSVADTLLRNTPYSWYVVSKPSSGNVSQSDTWKFYNAGASTVSYAPFPAELLLPAQGETHFTYLNNNGVSLSWKGSSVDQNIVNYDVYFGTSPTPPLYLPRITGMQTDYISVVPKTTYYWKVLTRDINGNTSESVIFQFTY